jgi:periplasmic divalent cation tolerance protein
MADKTAAEYCVVLTTTDSEQNAQAIVDVVLDRRLAACIQVVPMTSHYVWEGQITNAKELLLILKAKSSDYPELESAIRSAHHYEIPEIISFGIDGGYKPYLDWIKGVTR